MAAKDVTIIFII